MISREDSVLFANSMLCMKSKKRRLYREDYGRSLNRAVEPALTVRRNGQTALQQQAPIEPTEYQKNLEQGLPTFQLTSRDVRYWSDFNRVFYHPRSIVQLNEYELRSQTMPFESWTAGQELFQNLDKEADLLDRDLRSFAEECDQLQGLQMFCSTDNAWGGFSASYLDRLRDEFGKTSIWVWGLEDGQRVSRVRSTFAAFRCADILTWYSKSRFFRP
jgi:hypothetical protein